jgi:T4 RnlA family RNA ligase
MDVVKYLKEFGIGKLVTDFAIKVKEYDEGLIVLNYNQIDSPKSHPIVMECRGLILDKEFNVVSRSFDRFFNLGEQPDTQAHIDMRKAVCYEKIDGSLIRIYNWNGTWYIATRGTAFAESEVNGFPLTFKELVVQALGKGKWNGDIFQSFFDDVLDPDVTYICEITSVENRVVRAYSGYTLHYLAARHNKTFEYVDGVMECRALGCSLPNKYLFDSTEACLETANHLKDLDEGYVLYQEGKPVCKIKSPSYVAVHNIRGEGLNPKRICQIVLTGEQEEYLTYFNEDRHFFTPYVEALTNMKVSMQLVYDTVANIESQKDFALAVKGHSFSAVLFQARKLKESISVVFDKQTDLHKIRLLEEAVG